nr:hypothetical protein [Pedobacter sp. ASV19]
MTPVSDEAFNRLIRIMEMFLPLTAGFKKALRGLLYEATYLAGEKILYYREFRKMYGFCWMEQSGKSDGIEMQQEIIMHGSIFLKTLFMLCLDFLDNSLLKVYLRFWTIAGPFI